MSDKTQPDPIQDLTEKTFRLLGALQNVNPQDMESQKELSAALIEQYKCIVPFLQQGEK